MKKEVKVWHLLVSVVIVMIVMLFAYMLMLKSNGGKVNHIGDNIIVSIITSISTVLVAIIAGIFREKQIEENKPDLGELNYDDVIGHIIDSIQERFNVYRCAYWCYTNGIYTGDNYGLQNFSMVVEKNQEGVHEVIQEMQMIPKQRFRRNITPLRMNAYHISYEDEHNDPLAMYNISYGVKTAIFFKVINRGKWTGVLGLGFNESHKIISEEDIAWLLVQVGRIESKIQSINELKNKHKK